MYGVGQNPVYLQRMAEREAKKKASGEGLSGGGLPELPEGPQDGAFLVQGRLAFRCAPGRQGIGCTQLGQQGAYCGRAAQPSECFRRDAALAPRLPQRFGQQLQ